MSDFAVVPGVGVITCQQAVDYRDGKLFAEYEAALRTYDAGKEDRIRLVRQEFVAQKARIIQEWKSANEANKRKVAANAVGVALSGGGLATAKWMNTRTALTPIEKQGAEILIDRGTTFIDTAISGGLTGDISTTGLVLLPVLTVVGIVASPVVSATVTAVGIGVGVIGLADSLWKYFIDEQDYANDANQFADALERLAEKSVSRQISDIMRVKNEIDQKCNA
ncbi:MAG: hypothetical protein KZQ82_19355 [Candidatus Thiodiazotropha sp. (ex Lucinoma annulata)]|nr:hypothetical protein [Candidatus Thiodiazotropha sp. (ex Lucinoma annulata)]